MALKHKNEKAEWLETAMDDLANGRISAFFDKVDDNVQWSIETSHPTTGTSRLIRNKKDVRVIFDKFQKNLKIPLKYRIKKIYHDEKNNVYIVRLEAYGTSVKDLPYEIPQCWIITLAEDPYRIVQMVIYSDSLALSQFYQEQELTKQRKPFSS